MRKARAAAIGLVKLLIAALGVLQRDFLRWTFGPSDGDIAAADVAQQRRIAEVSARPMDRRLAQALIRPQEAPIGMVEQGRAWRRQETAGVTAVVEQYFVERSRRPWRRSAGRRLMLELRRYADHSAAAAALAPPRRTMTDGSRMRERAASTASLRVFSWEPSEQTERGERVLELRLRRGTATAMLRAANRAPSPQWETEMVDLLRQVGARLR